MNNVFIVIFVYVGYITLLANATEISLTQDTYVDALQNSQQTNFDGAGGYQYNPPNDIGYLPPPSSPPASAYGRPPVPFYNSPPQPFYKPASPLPYHSHDSWFLDKLKNKINLFTLGKIMLKLLIFKKIVKFIGIICLLLVLPKLKNLFNDSMTGEDGEMHSKILDSDTDKLQKQINYLYEFIITSIHDFEQEHT